MRQQTKLIQLIFELHSLSNLRPVQTINDSTKKITVQNDYGYLFNASLILN